MTNAGGIDVASFRALVGKTSQLEPKLKAQLRKEIRTASAPAVAEVKAGLAGGRPGGLRAGISARVRASISATARAAGVKVTSSGPLAAAWESKSGWRHPVFGNRRTYVRQMGHPYFREVITRHGNTDIAAAVNKAMADAAATLSQR